MYWTEKAWISVRSFLSRLSLVSWAAEKRAILEWHTYEARSLSGRLRLDGGKYVIFTKGVWMNLTPDELVERIADRYDPDFIVEILNITSEKVLYAFLDEVIDNQAKFDLWEHGNGDEAGTEEAS